VGCGGVVHGGGVLQTLGAKSVGFGWRSLRRGFVGVGGDVHSGGDGIQLRFR
jgi:hypothetical protein